VNHRKSQSQSDLSDSFFLSRTQSAQSYNSDFRSGRSKNGRKVTHLLNGRVYGGRRTATVPPSSNNPFANLSDEADSEFVEWGYGGMGSVRSGGDGIWKRVQSENNGVMFGSVDPGVSRPGGRTKGGGGGGGGEDDGDDGGGMAWVKKRREQREREKREKEEKERAEKEQASSQDSPAVVPKDERLPRDPTVADTRAGSTSVSQSTNEEHHVLRAVTLPFAKHVHHLRGNSTSSVVGSLRSPSRIGSAASSRVPSVLELPSGGGVDAREVNGAVRRVEEGVGDDDDEEDEDEDEIESENGSGNSGSDDEEEDEVSWDFAIFSLLLRKLTA
jgi:hypothetical protein